MMKGTVSWFGKEWIENDAKALGVYITLLILQFRVRYGTDIPILSRDEWLMETRLKPYLALFLHDEEELKEAVDTGKGFLKALSKNTSFSEYEAVLDTTERDFYDNFKDVYLRHVNREATAVKIVDYDAPTLIKTFLNDVSSNKISKGKITTAGSSILLQPVSELINFYGLSQEDANKFLDVLRKAGIMFLDIVPAPVLEEEFVESIK